MRCCALCCRFLPTPSAKDCGPPACLESYAAEFRRARGEQCVASLRCNVSRRFTSPMGLASVSAEPKRAGYGHADLRQGPAVYAAAEGGRGVFVRGVAGAVDLFPWDAVHRGARSGPKIEVDAFYDAAAGCR